MSETTAAIKEAAIAELREAGRYLGANQLAWGNAGNMSARTVADRYVITASGTRLNDLQPGDFAECVVGGGTAGGERRKPSKETPMHAAIYRVRPEMGAVLHASPFYSTMIACSELELPGDVFVEDMYYLERVARVPYHHPGSTALGDAVAAKAQEANILLLEQHGVLVYDETVREAVMALHTLEVTARMVLEAQSAGVTLRRLPSGVVEDFLTRSGYRPRRRWTV